MRLLTADGGFRYFSLGGKPLRAEDGSVAGAVVGARTLVLKDVPPYAVVVGQPARILRFRFDEALIARFLAAQWWRFSPALIGRLPVTDPQAFIEAFEEMVERDAPTPMAPAALSTADLLAACAPKPALE